MAWSKESRHARGYGAAWTRLRLLILERDGYICRCAECRKTGRLRVATEVDHRIPKAKGGTDDPANLQAIAKPCHERKSLLEKGVSIRPTIGVDGWPIRR